FFYEWNQSLTAHVVKEAPNGNQRDLKSLIVFGDILTFFPLWNFYLTRDHSFIVKDIDTIRILDFLSFN
ncbi:MAG: hypothetical protein ACTTJ3_09315, partial [Treponema sp.]